MSKLHRYYGKEVLTSATLSFLVLFGVVAISMIYRGIARAQGGSMLDALLITLLWTADAFPHLLAIALLFGTIVTFARAAADGETIAIMAAGVSLRVPMEAAMLVAMALSGVAGVCEHYVIPWAHYHKFRVVAELMREFLLHTRPAGDQIALDDVVMTWGREEAVRMRDVVVFARGEVLLADAAWFDIDNEWVSLRMQGVRSPAAGMVVQAPTLRRSLHEMADISERVENEDDVTSDRLLAEVYRGGSPNPNRALYMVHRRTCYALLPCLLMPIGLCIGVLARDRGRAAAMAFGLIPVVLFYVADFAGQGVARAVDGPLLSATSAYLSAALLLGAGVPFCWRTLRS